MPDQLVVHLNRRDLYDVEPAVTSFEAAGSFDIVLRNHGQAVHVHLRLDDALSSVAALDATNHFVPTESNTVAPVRVAERPRQVRGMLKVVTGYGSGTDFVEVHVSEPAPEESTVPVDEDLSRPRTEQSRGDALAAALLDDERPFVVGMAAVALAVAGGTWLLAKSVAVLVGVLAVLVGVAVAAYLLVA